MKNASRNADQALLLVVDDGGGLCFVVARALRSSGFKVAVARDHQAALALAAREARAAAGGSIPAPVEQPMDPDKRTRIVVLTGYASFVEAVEVMKRGTREPPDAANEDRIGTPGGEIATAFAPVYSTPVSFNRMAWEHIQRVLAENNGNVSVTARQLCMHRRTLQRKLNKHPVRA